MAFSRLVRSSRDRRPLRNRRIKRAAAARALAIVLRPENPGESFFSAPEWQSIGTALDFSDRELEVTVLMVEGLSRQDIAACLRKTDGPNISSQTVRVYIDRIFQKARVHDRLGLALRLVRIHRDLGSSVSVDARSVSVRAASRAVARRTAKPARNR